MNIESEAKETDSDQIVFQIKAGPTNPEHTVSIGHCSLIGKRPTMEDDICILNQFQVDSPHINGLLSFYAVFDGHGGREAAAYMSTILFSLLKNELRYNEPEKALVKAFTLADKQWLDTHGCQYPGGTTCTSLLFNHSTMNFWIANTGDSRILLCRNSQPIQLTADHRPTRSDENERIKANGGYVIHNRVMGELAVSRALGDYSFKEKYPNLILSEPEITSGIFSAVHDSFFVAACDGLLMSELSATGNAQKAIKSLVKHAVLDRDSRDNVSAILIIINGEYEETEQETASRDHLDSDDIDPSIYDDDDDD